MPIVSVVIPNYNHGAFIGRAVQSVLTSRLSDIELVIVDDGSTDELTLRALADLEAEGVTVLRQENAGPAAARNLGIGNTRAPYVLPLDADDEIDPTYLEKALLILERSPEIGFVTSWVEAIGVNSAIWRPHVSARPEDWWEHNRAVSAAVFRRELWTRVDGYDSSLDGYEDWDFWLRLVASGAAPYQLREPLFRYHMQPNSRYARDRLSHDELIAKVRAKHPQIRPKHPVLRRGLLISRRGLHRSLHASRIGRDFLAAIDRDLSAIRYYGVRPWATWRGFQVASHVPGAVRAYRIVRERTRKLFTSAPAPKEVEPRENAAASKPFHRLRIKPTDRAGILYVVPWLNVGGADKVNLEIIRNLDQERFAPTILTTLGHDHPWASEFRHYTTDIFHLASFPAAADVQLSLFEHLIKSRNIKIVQTSNSEVGFQLLPDIKSIADVATVTLVHCEEPGVPRDYVTVAAELHSYLDRYVAVADRVGEALVSQGARPEQVITIRNGVDTDMFAPGRSAWLAEEFGVVESHVITFVGRLTDQKDPLLFARALMKLASMRDCSDIAVVIVGDGPLRDVVAQALKPVGDQMSIKWLGQRTEGEVARVLQSTSMLVAPSTFEGLPIVGLEAMASGVPIVATDVPGWTDLLEDGRTGVIAQPRAEAVAMAINELLDAPDRRRDIGLAAREEVLRSYSMSGMTLGYAHLYSELLSRATR